MAGMPTLAEVYGRADRLHPALEDAFVYLKHVIETILERSDNAAVRHYLRRELERIDDCLSGERKKPRVFIAGFEYVLQRELLPDRPFYLFSHSSRELHYYSQHPPQDDMFNGWQVVEVKGRPLSSDDHRKLTDATAALARAAKEAAPPRKRSTPRLRELVAQHFPEGRATFGQLRPLYAQARRESGMSEKFSPRAMSNALLAIGMDTDEKTDGWNGIWRSEASGSVWTWDPADMLGPPRRSGKTQGR